MRKFLLAAACVVAVSPALAKDVEIDAASCAASTRCQAAFDSVAQDLVAAIDYKAVGPAAATGLTGFGIGVVGTYVPVSHSDDWKAVTGTDFSGIPVVGVQVTKGLPLDLDVGAFFSKAPGTDASLYGAELRYAILAGSATTPAIALRGSYSKLTGVDSFSLDSKAIDLSLSKGIGPITPYVGVGYVYGDAKPDVTGGPSESKVHKTKAYLGARVSLLLLGFTPEIETVGGTLAYSLRFGFSFGL